MGPLESLHVALRGLSANKLRSALTMLGIIIGVGAVIALMSVGKGAEQSVLNRIRSMGTNLLFVTPGSTRQEGVAAGAGTAPTLTYEDAVAIAGSGPPIMRVAPESASNVQVIYGSANTRTRVTGTTPEYEEVRNFHVARGEFFTQQDVDSNAMVVVLGSNTALQVFGDGEPIGETVRLTTGSGAGSTGYTFRVIGVMESKGSQAMGNQDDVVFVPITTLQQRLSNQRTAQGARNVSTVNVQVSDERSMDAAVQQIGNVLRDRHQVVEDDFLIRSQEDMLETATEVTGVMTVLLGAIAGISLVVGGIGIMNIMLVSVTERTREIGIRKAVGARRRDILTQFLLESALLAVVGGATGITVGVAVAHFVSGLSLAGQTFTAVVTADAIVLAAGVSAAIGLFFGIYPALRAARLHPIEALRYE
ncbi:MAG: ABC transporter permease [Chloroflexi bacterium]|nr:ABC transporter permease [Chloroflexota bacterium]